MRVWPGTPYPLGATWDGAGTNFALFSEVAEQVELCLLDPATRPDAAPETRIALTEVDGLVWHCYLPGRGARASATATGCTARTSPSAVTGATRPSCCSIPYGKAVDGEVRWHQAVYSYQHGNPSALNTDGQRPVHAAQRGDQPVLRLGR